MRYDGVHTTSESTFYSVCMCIYIYNTHTHVYTQITHVYSPNEDYRSKAMAFRTGDRTGQLMMPNTDQQM